jgi:pectate lyase
MKKLLFGISFLVACGNLSKEPTGRDGSTSGAGAPGSALGGSSETGGVVAGTGGTSSVSGGTGGILGDGTGGSTTTSATGGRTGIDSGGRTSDGGATGAAGARGGASGGRSATGGTAGAAGSTIPAGGRLGGGGTSGLAAGGAAGAGATTPAAGGKTATGSGGVAGGSVGKGGGSGNNGGNPGGGSVGWSAGPPETKPIGYGQATTGGGSAAAVEVSSMAALQAAIDAYSGSGGLSLRYTGKFNFSSISDPCAQHSLAGQIVEIKRKSDISIVGADGSAANFGIHIASSASNIIIRNMTFGLLPGGEAADAISVEGMSGGAPTNIWIDHNELFSAMVSCSGAGDASFDGLIDLKKGADKVTVSYNYLHDHEKVSLNGFSDSDTEVRHITFHHNIFENVGSRTPLQRTGYSHFVNNYLHQVKTSGANIRMKGYSLIEANYFDTVKNPVTSRDSDAIGYWDLRDNNITGPADFATYNITWSDSDSSPSVNATDWKTTAAYPEALGYSYTAGSPACMRAGLSSVAGAGKGLATLKCD